MTTPDTSQNRKHIAVYAGSFDPITYGHLDVLRRSRRLFDGIVLGIGINPNKAPLFSQEERVAMARTLVEEMVAEEPEDAPVQVDQYQGLTMDFARNCGASAMLRGIRNITDLAVECQLAITNRRVADLETVFIVTAEEYSFTSSSLIRQIAAMGGSLDRLASMLPPPVLERLAEMQADPSRPLSRLVEDQHID
jgi:pantetheine-phosphate adenylyltransferase